MLTNVSRHSFSSIYVDDDGRLFLEDRVPFRFRVYGDTVSHVVREGHTLFNLAGKYYRLIDRAAGLWWVIADFQPIPIQDPTIRLVPGSVLYVPSVRAVARVILSDQRLRESE